jgi:hypothetical protein
MPKTADRTGSSTNATTGTKLGRALPERTAIR